jgi:hypothetical protein
VLAGLGGGVSALVVRSAVGAVTAGQLVVLAATSAAGAVGAVGVLLATCPEYRQHLERVRGDLPPLRRPAPAHRIRVPRPVPGHQAERAAGARAGVRGGAVGLRQPAWPPAAPVSVRPYVQRPTVRPDLTRRDRARPGRWQGAGSDGAVHASPQAAGGVARPASRRAAPARAVPSAVPDLTVLRRAIAILATEVYDARLSRHQVPNVGFDRKPVALGARAALMPMPSTVGAEE